MREKTPKKPRPSQRGEKWKLWDGRMVTILQPLRGGAVEVLNPEGRTEVHWGSEFKEKKEEN